MYSSGYVQSVDDFTWSNHGIYGDYTLVYRLFLGNFFLPLQIGAKDVAFPRSQPAYPGTLLITGATSSSLFLVS